MLSTAGRYPSASRASGTRIRPDNSSGSSVSRSRSIAIDSWVKTQGDKVVSVHHSRGQREGKTLDADESIEFTFSGDKISRLDVTSTDQAAEDAFWG